MDVFGVDGYPFGGEDGGEGGLVEVIKEAPPQERAEFFESQNRKSFDATKHFLKFFLIKVLTQYGLVDISPCSFQIYESHYIIDYGYYLLSVRRIFFQTSCDFSQKLLRVYFGQDERKIAVYNVRFSIFFGTYLLPLIIFLSPFRPFFTFNPSHTALFCNIGIDICQILQTSNMMQLGSQGQRLIKKGAAGGAWCGIAIRIIAKRQEGVVVETKIEVH